MPVTPDHVFSDTEIPKQTAVAVIGGGIIGVATALELAERGIDVTLLEKGVIAGEQSSRNWGWCRQMGRDPREIPADPGGARSLARHERPDRRRDRLSPKRHHLSLRDRCGAGGARELARTQCQAFRPRHAHRLRRGGREPAAWCDAALERRPLHLGRRPRRAFHGRARHGPGRPQEGRQDPHPMRGARPRNLGRQSVGGRHRKGPHRLRHGGAGGRRLVAPFPRQSRHSVPAALGRQFGDALRPHRNAARALLLGRQILAAQAPRRRLHDRPPASVGGRHPARFISLVPRIPASSESRLEWVAA